MTDKNAVPKTIQDFEAEDKAKVAEAVYAKFGHQLKPGESLVTTIERTAEHVHASIALERYDDAEHVEIEGSVLAVEEKNGEVKLDARFELLLDFLDNKFSEYFEQQRDARFHDDWRPYAFEGLVIRFRGISSKPQLEALADDWLLSAGFNRHGESEE